VGRYSSGGPSCGRLRVAGEDGFVQVAPRGSCSPRHARAPAEKSCGWVFSKARARRDEFRPAIARLPKLIGEPQWAQKRRFGPR